MTLLERIMTYDNQYRFWRRWYLRAHYPDAINLRYRLSSHNDRLQWQRLALWQAHPYEIKIGAQHEPERVEGFGVPC